MTERLTIHAVARLKERGQAICMVTAYDATFARLVDDAGADAILVGDSLGMVIQGESSTLTVTMEQMVYHCRAVSRGSRRALVIGDLPFMSYQASTADAVRNAGRLVAEGGVSTVKLEGGSEFASTAAAIVRAGVPVVGHIGLMPQWIHATGGYLVQGREERAAQKLRDDALELQDAGCWALVLEAMPLDLAQQITESLAIPTIGIGAGPHCAGQVLVCYDLLGMSPDFHPRFVERYADLHQEIRRATSRFFDDVRAGRFPREEHSFKPRAAATHADSSSSHR